MMQRRWIGAVCALLVSGVTVGSDAIATAAPLHRSEATALAAGVLRSDAALSGDAAVATDGRYVVVLSDPGFSDARLRLIDTSSGTTRQLSLPRRGCGLAWSVAVGGGVVAVGCESTDFVSSISSRAWRAVAVSHSLSQDCARENCTLEGVGSRWLEIGLMVMRGETGFDGTIDQSLSDPSRSAVEPSTAATVVDLDGRAPTHGVCAPVSVPRGTVGVSQYGRTVYETGRSSLVEARCGSRRTVRYSPILTTTYTDRFGSAAASTSSAGAAWLSPSGRTIDGFTTGRTVRPFHFAVPASLRADDQYVTLLVTGRDVYAIDGLDNRAFVGAVS